MIVHYTNWPILGANIKEETETEWHHIPLDDTVCGIWLTDDIQEITCENCLDEKVADDKNPDPDGSLPWITLRKLKERGEH